MQKMILRKIIVLVVFSITIMVTGSNAAAASRMDKVVENARKNYYGTNEKIQKGIYGKYEDSTHAMYWDEKEKVRKAVVYPSDSLSVKNCTCEYYYNKNERLVFAYAYKNADGKLKEYRVYFSAGGKCAKMYRYIGPNGVVKDYPNGAVPKDDTMASLLLLWGQMEIHYAGHM